MINPDLKDLKVNTTDYENPGAFLDDLPIISGEHERGVSRYWARKAIRYEKRIMELEKELEQYKELYEAMRR